MQNYDYQFKMGANRPTTRYQFDAIEPNGDQLNRDVNVVSTMFSMRAVSTGDLVLMDTDATLVDDAGCGLLTGVVEYQVEPSELDQTGLHAAEFELTYRNGSTRFGRREHHDSGDWRCRMSDSDTDADHADARIHVAEAVPAVGDDEHVASSFESQECTVEELKTLIDTINEARQNDGTHEFEPHYERLDDELRSHH